MILEELGLGLRVLETRKWTWLGFQGPRTIRQGTGSEGSGTREFRWVWGAPWQRKGMGGETVRLRRSVRFRASLGTKWASPEVSFLFSLLSFSEGPTGLPDRPRAGAGV